jgi:ankyrin repeat protein
MMAAPRLGTESPPLYAAVENRDLARVEKLLGEGASVNTPGDLGFTPLHLAAMRVRILNCLFLIANPEPPALYFYLQTQVNCFVVTR